MSTTWPAITRAVPPSQGTSMVVITTAGLAAIGPSWSVGDPLVAHVVAALHVGAQVAGPDGLVQQLRPGAACGRVREDHLVLAEQHRPQFRPAGGGRGGPAVRGGGGRARSHGDVGGEHVPGQGHQNPQPGLGITASPPPYAVSRGLTASWPKVTALAWPRAAALTGMLVADPLAVTLSTSVFWPVS